METNNTGNMNRAKSPKFDLHVHTTASDGSLNSRQIVAEAKRIGLTTMAITDHDTIGNVKECIEEGKKQGIRIIAGVELSAEIDKGKMHILGYGIDPDNREFNIVMQMLREAREARNKNIIEALKCLFKIEISIDDVKKYAKGETIGKPHIAAAIVEKGYCSDIESVFKKILGTKRMDSIERKKLPPKSCIELIKKAGGFAFLAHPNSLKLTQKNTFAKIKELQRYGLVGVEAYHSSNTPAQNNAYVNMANELGLMISCGSDFHGIEIKKDVKLGFGVNENLPTDNEELIVPLLKALNM